MLLTTDDIYDIINMCERNDIPISPIYNQLSERLSTFPSTAFTEIIRCKLNRMKRFEERK